MRPILKCPESTAESIDSSPAPSLHQSLSVKEEEERDAALQEFRRRSPWLSVPTDASAPSSPLEEQLPSLDHLDDAYWLDHFKAFCDDACLLRYLRAYNWCLYFTMIF